MRLYESEAKEIFQESGIPIPNGGVAWTSEDARRIAERVGIPVAIKPQVLAGGRGRAGLIRFAENLENVEKIAVQLLDQELAGCKVASLLVEEKLQITKELYVGFTIDGTARLPVVIASSEGGVEIEEIATVHPDRIVKRHLDVFTGLQDFQARTVARKIGLLGDLGTAATMILRALHNIFRRYDALLVEVNPLAITKDRSLVAVDAKLILDEYALYRHPDYKARLERRKGALTPAGLREMETRAAGINAYVELDGDVGVLANGASLGMETIDLVSDLGGEPACFCDMGGVQSVELVESAVDIILSNPRVKLLLVNILGGLTRCDVIAEGICRAASRIGGKVPLVVRLSGALEDEGRRILRKIGIEPYDNIFEAAARAVEMMENAG